MPIHFAAARSAARSPVARALARRAVRRAANDNPGADDAAEECGSEARMLGAALRHFADHGLRAAEAAAQEAERAWRAGERDASRWWLEVCRKLDRPLARELARRIEMQDVG